MRITYEINKGICNCKKKRKINKKEIKTFRDVYNFTTKTKFGD